VAGDVLEQTDGGELTTVLPPMAELIITDPETLLVVLQLFALVTTQ
jgi:hypothetical protein